MNLDDKVARMRGQPRPTMPNIDGASNGKKRKTPAAGRVQAQMKKMKAIPQTNPEPRPGPLPVDMSAVRPGPSTMPVNQNHTIIDSESE